MSLYKWVLRELTDMGVYLDQSLKSEPEQKPILELSAIVLDWYVALGR